VPGESGKINNGILETLYCTGKATQRSPWHPAQAEKCRERTGKMKKGILKILYWDM